MSPGSGLRVARRNCSTVWRGVMAGMPVNPSSQLAGPRGGQDADPGKIGECAPLTTVPETAPRLKSGRCGLTHGGDGERILAAATAVFAADGLPVPLDEIARRAGVGAGTLYRHFPAKEALWEAVLLGRLQRLADEAEALHRVSDPSASDPSASDPGEALLGFIDRLVAEAAPKRDLADALASPGTT